MSVEPHDELAGELEHQVDELDALDVDELDDERHAFSEGRSAYDPDVGDARDDEPAF